MLIYRNPDEDSELRIAAYLAVMQCPTQYVVDQIKETLASEEVNQVGFKTRFVTTVDLEMFTRS